MNTISRRRHRLVVPFFVLALWITLGLAAAQSVPGSGCPAPATPLSVTGGSFVLRPGSAEFCHRPCASAPISFLLVGLPAPFLLPLQGPFCSVPCPVGCFPPSIAAPVQSNASGCFRIPVPMLTPGAVFCLQQFCVPTAGSCLVVSGSLVVRS